MRMISYPAAARSLVAVACAVTCLAASAATITISSRDPAGVGFNDPTPVAPVGGNPGTTLGQQRYNVYRYVADIWERNLTSNVNITVSAGWEALTCTSNSAVLGSAGAWNIWRDFPGAKPNTWYHQALANKIAGVNLSDGQEDDGSGFGNVDIKTQFNVNLGKPDCLAGSAFYLGLDGNAGSNVNFVATLLHELGHGLGFSALTVTTSTGARYDNRPSVWEQFMYDNTAQKTWLNMTNAERKASAINPLKLAWIGPNSVAAASLLRATPVLKVTSPQPGASRLIDYNNSPFGALPVTPSTAGALANVAPQAGELGNACSPFDAANTSAVQGKVAIISRGGCTFVIKVKNAQNAGAVAAILANNIAGPLLPGGADGTITIPSGGVTQADGELLKASVPGAVPYGARGKPGVATALWSSDPSRIAGADPQGRPLLYTPAVLASGSSVSHWDVTASPNLLMEPNINADLGIILDAPKDLTLPLMRDLGW
jgi:hypothetical protein